MRFGFKTLSLENVATPATGTAAGIGVVIGPWIDYFYGGGKGDILAVFLTLIAADWITGIAAALKDKTYSSEYGISGIFRT